MSINLPSRQLSRSASMHLQSARPAVSSAQLHLSLSLLALSKSLPCRSNRHFQTSTSTQRSPTLRPGSYVDPKNESSLKPSARRTPSPTTQSLVKDVKESPTPEDARMDTQKRAEAAAASARARITQQQQAAPQQGSLADNSLFADQQSRSTRQQGTEDSMDPASDQPTGLDPAALELRDPSRLAAALNPRPKARSLWQRRMVIRSIRQRGRLTKKVKLARTERSLLHKSHFFQTSMKKLAPLARQIAGKPIDEAILQMRFSKKKVARDVREHLIHAKNEAIVARGMGLGHPENPNPELNPEPPNSTSTSLSPLSDAPPTFALAKPKLKTLPGTTIPSDPALRPPTEIYISQAWINRGPYEQKPDYRAFGRVYIMRPPNTGLSVLLKEEKTRAREAAEKETKRIRRRMGKNMWTQLPDRKVTRQGQYLLW